jgi:hypothetical protein
MKMENRYGGEKAGRKRQFNGNERSFSLPVVHPFKRKEDRPMQS